MPALPKLSSPPQVLPEDTGKPWTAIFKFAGSGQTTVTWGCLDKGLGTAENIGYAITVEGRYGHGKAEEVFTLSIGKPTGMTDVPPWMGNHTFTTYLDCPAGDPWLLGKACSVTGTATPIPGMKFNGPFPLTFQQVPAAERGQLLYKAFPPRFVAPAENQKLENGQPVTVQLVKSGPVAAQPVTLEFSSGAWTTAKTFTRTMTGSSLTVEGTAFTPGDWRVTARYQGDKSIGGAERKFVIAGAWGGGPPGGTTVQKPRPGAEGQVAPVPVPVPVTPSGRSRGN